MSQPMSCMPAFALSFLLMVFAWLPSADAQQSYRGSSRSAQSYNDDDSNSDQSSDDSAYRRSNYSNSRTNRRATDQSSQSSQQSWQSAQRNSNSQYSDGSGSSSNNWQSQQGGGYSQRNSRDYNDTSTGNNWSNSRNNSNQNRVNNQNSRNNNSSSSRSNNNQNDDNSDSSTNYGDSNDDQNQSRISNQWQQGQQYSQGQRGQQDSTRGMNSNNGRNANSNQQNQDKTENKVSPAVASAILPSGWRRIAGRDVPALPATLPNLPAVIRSDDGVNVNVTDTVRTIASGDDIIAVVEAMGMSNSIYGAPESSITAAGQAAPHHLRFDQRLISSQISDLDGTLFIANSLRRYRSLAMQIRSASSMPVVIIDEMQPAAERVQKIAAALGFPAQGRGLATEIQRQFDRAQALARQRSSRPRVAILSVNEVDNQPLYAGDNTTAGEIVRYAGGVNVANQMNISDYGSIQENRIMSASPDVIVISEYDLGRLGGANNLFKAYPGLQATPAGRNKRVMVMPDLQLKIPTVAAGAGALALSQAFSDFNNR